MTSPARYARLVKRHSLAVPLIVASLSIAGVAASGPPKASVGVKDGKAHLAVSSGSASPQALANAAAAAVASATEKPEDPIEHAKKGIVTIERAGEVLGLGTVLKDDGRILTALSPLGDGNSLDVRYPDGSVVHSKVGHSDRVWDLALLVPQVGRWPDGLAASSGDALKSGAQLRAFSPGKNHVQPATILVKGTRSLLGADAQIVRDVFDIGTKIGPKELGSPIVDETGSVVGLLGRACVPVEKGPCAPTSFGVPVSALKQFLRTTPVSAVPPAPWLGLQGVADKAGPVSGVRVVSIAPDGPADEAGLHGGADKAVSDLLVAIDDKPVLSPEALAQALHEKAVGDRVKLLVFSAGKFRDVNAVLRPAPGR